ncbi:hypothetical protein [Streptomyces sp. NPDC051173]|uniref:hypothetical protein n=1 Tax=Streptomyces sp. NPDC051173 TaxID=3155164 RepID=UPI00344BA0D6
MSTFSQNPEPLDFDRITRDVPMASAWQTTFDEAEEMLRATRPEGFDVEKIGRVAFDRLPEHERDGALDVLFYTYWAALRSDRETAIRAPKRPRAEDSYLPAMPWAKLMDPEDLHDFLGDLAEAAMRYFRPVATDAGILQEIEKACMTWRLIAEAQHAHNTAAGPHSNEAGDR